MSIENCSRLADAIASASAFGGQLDGLSRQVYAALGAALLTDEEASRLLELAQLRRREPVRPARPRSRPVKPEHVQRRRRWVASGWLPPQVASLFTEAERAVLSVIASEVARHGECRLCVGAIAGLAGVSRSSAKAAYRHAASLRLVMVTERRLTGWRNDTNVVRIVSPEWLAWLRHGAKRGGVKRSTGFEYGRQKRASLIGVAGVQEGLRGKALAVSGPPETGRAS